MKNSYNLVDEPWIPVANHKRVSLAEIFSNPTLKSISGNALHKVSLLKILLAIAQRAFTPYDDEEWLTLESAGLAKKCLNYLEEKKDLFWLYGERPFLQKPDLATLKTSKGEPIPIAILGKDYPPDLPLDNESILFESQLNQELTDAEKAVLIVSLMNYSLAGKRVAKDVSPWTKGYSGKTTSAKGGPSIGNYHGYQNSHLIGESLIDTIWLNLFTKAQLNLFPQWENDLLIPPWEEFPKGEDDSIARRLKESFMSTLCAVSRFLLLKDGGIIYVEGLQYPSHKEGWREPFMTYGPGPDGRIIWNDPAVKPWRNLPALLSTAFHGTDGKFNSPQIGLLILRSRRARKIVGIWAGGLKVRGTAGDMSVKQSDDFIDSITFFKTGDMGEPWFISFENEILELENIEYNLKRAISAYYKSLSSITPSALPKAIALFWELCSQQIQRLVEICDEPEKMDSLRKEFIGYAYHAYNTYCPNQTARQMISWAKTPLSLGGREQIKRRYLLANSRAEDFVTYIIRNVSSDKDKGFGAKIRKSDNEATEFQAWEILAKWVDLERQGERRAFALIGASLARLKPLSNGSLSIGGALRQAHLLGGPSTELDKSSTALRFNRILACRDQEEIINIIRPTLRYIESKGILLDYSQLLNEIVWFNNENSRERTRARWAKHFLRKGGGMIASQVSLDRIAIQQLKLSDPYTIHKFVYSLFPGDQRKFIYYDQGGNWQYRKILILSEVQPTLPVFGKIESKYVPPSFLRHKSYAFQVLLNPVEQPKGKKNKSPVVGKGPLYDWFLKKQSDWGFTADPVSLEILTEGVQIIERKGCEIIHNRAEFRGILQVTNYDLFYRSFSKGIGRAKAFGFGLLQLRPLKERSNQ